MSINRVMAVVAVSLAVGTFTPIANADQFSEPPYGAAEVDIKEALKNCSANQISINICAWHRYKETEKDLENATARLSGALSNNEQRQALDTAHREFIQFRNATCAFDLARVEGGSMGFSVLYRCRRAYDTRRIHALNYYVDCLAGRVSCELPYFLFVYENSN